MTDASSYASECSAWYEWMPQRAETIRMRQIKAREIVRVLLKELVNLQGVTPQLSEPIEPHLELFAELALADAVAAADQAPIMEAAPNVRAAIIARMQCFIVDAMARPEKIVARVPKGAKDAVLLAMALKLLRHGKGSRLSRRL